MTYLTNDYKILIKPLRLAKSGSKSCGLFCFEALQHMV